MRKVLCGPTAAGKKCDMTGVIGKLLRRRPGGNGTDINGRRIYRKNITQNNAQNNPRKKQS